MKRNIRSLVRPLAVPAAHVLKQEVLTRSYFGGDAHLSSNMPWPQVRKPAKIAMLAVRMAAGVS